MIVHNKNSQAGGFLAICKMLFVVGPTRAGSRTASVPPGPMLRISLLCGLETSDECVAWAGEAVAGAEIETVEGVSAACVAASGDHELEAEEVPDVSIHRPLAEFASVSPHLQLQNLQAIS